MHDWMENLGVIGGILMPFFNIPLILKIIERKSANGISLIWLFGIWGCILLMLPSSLVSTNMTLKGFGISNALLFTIVVVVVMIYRKR